MFKLLVLLCCIISPMMSMHFRKSNMPALQVSEMPFWSNGNLYYVDMYAKTLYRYSYCEDKVYEASVADNQDYPGFLIPIKDDPNRFIVGLGTKGSIINWDGRSATATKERDLFTIPPNTNLNTLMVSPENDWYTGNYADSLCAATPNLSVFGYSRSKKFKTFANNLGSTVGMVMIEATKTVYQIDPCQQTLHAFTWDASTGELTNGRTVLKLNLPHDVLPAGLAADTNGFLYTGAYNGGYVIKIDPNTREIVDKIEVPTPYITAPAFGGPNLDILFVTTASLPMDFHSGIAGKPLPPPAGYVFQIPMNVTGIPTYIPRV